MRIWINNFEWTKTMSGENSVAESITSNLTLSFFQLLRLGNLVRNSLFSPSVRLGINGATFLPTTTSSNGYHALWVVYLCCPNHTILARSTGVVTMLPAHPSLTFNLLAISVSPPHQRQAALVWLGSTDLGGYPMLFPSPINMRCVPLWTHQITLNRPRSPLSVVPSNMHPSARMYTRFSLHLYDVWVLWLSNLFAWRCSTTQILSPFFNEHIKNSEFHLDIGVGTGYYPSHAIPHIHHNGQKTKLYLLDLNPNTLEFSKNRIHQNGYEGTIDTLEHDIFHPLPQEIHGKFDSISAFYLFHCLPGSFPTKMTAVLRNLLPVLSPSGIFYGATILGKGVEHNLFGRGLMSLYNRNGVFSNYEDGVEELKLGLREYFEDVEVRVVGVVALFLCRGPVQDGVQKLSGNTHDAE